MEGKIDTIKGVPASTHRRAVRLRKAAWKARDAIEKARNERIVGRWHIVYALADDPEFVVFDAELFHSTPDPMSNVGIDWEKAVRLGARGVVRNVEWEEWEPVAMVSGLGIEYHVGQGGWRSWGADLLTAQQVLAGDAPGVRVVFLHERDA